MFDTEQFIKEVECRPPLYDTQSEDYSSREKKYRCWTEIAMAMYWDWTSVSNAVKRIRVKELIKKWKAIRDNFVREHKLSHLRQCGQSDNRKRPYIFYDRLHFLAPYVRSSRDPAPQSDPVMVKLEACDSERQEDQSLFPAASEETPTANELAQSPPVRIGSATMKNHNRLAFRKSIKRAIATAALSRTPADASRPSVGRQGDVYGHEAFMMSFVPILNSMPLHAAMQARMQISQIVGYAYFETSQPAPAPPPTSQTEPNENFSYKRSTGLSFCTGEE